LSNRALVSVASIRDELESAVTIPTDLLAAGES
jgi:hypothetical protein